LLHKIERSFAFKFDDTELNHVKTFGELCDIITNKVQGLDSSDCTGQQAFYKIRNAIASSLLIDKNSITPDTDLRSLFPKEERRQKIKEVKAKLGFKFHMLEMKEWLKWLYFIGIVISIFMFIFNWRYALWGIAFFNLIGFVTHIFFATELVYKTVRELTEKFSRENYRKARRNSATVNRNEIENIVKELFKENLLLEEASLTREATF
jgi:hypothetical protein